jgi:hypothetical protein
VLALVRDVLRNDQDQAASGGRNQCHERDEQIGVTEDGGDANR